MASLEQKWKDDPTPFSPIKNSALTCRTCKHKTDKVSSCAMFETKPVSVLKGGVCYEYKKQ